MFGSAVSVPKIIIIVAAQCDDKLRAVFGKNSVTAFEMSKYFRQHMFDKDDPPLSHSVTEIVTPETKPKTVN